jgi:hypothetical protein
VNRVTLRLPIAETIDLLPCGIRRRVEHAEWLTGVDPVFAGLHPYTTSTDRRAYAATAHVCWPMHQGARPRSELVSTVVVPVDYGRWNRRVFVHELGHVLDEQIDFARHRPVPVSRYARTNNWEAFAEAFTLWALPEDCVAEGRYDQAALARDEETLALFEELAR